MSFQQSDAIVLRMHAWSETSLIGTVFTRGFGKLSLVAKGARRPKSPFENSLDLLSFSRIVFLSKSSDSPCLLTESKLIRRFKLVNRDLLRLYAAYYLAELLEKCTEIELSDQTALFDLADDTLRKLECQDCEVRAVVLRLELQFLRLTGHLPSFRSCVLCGVGIVPDRWIIYSPIAGGCVCRTCSATGRNLMHVPPAVCQYLERFSEVQWETIPLNEYINQHRALIRAMMTKTVAGLIDQRPRLHSYLEELGR